MAKKISRIFLDSNVVLSGLFSEKSAPRIILDILSLKLPFLIGLTGKYNLIEIERNLTKKLPGSLSLYKAYSAKMNLKIIPIPSHEEMKKFAGAIIEKDMPVLVSAVKGKTDFLVTGDKKDSEHLKTKGEYTFKILSPSEFVNVIIPEIVKQLSE